jgi:hypothetical protein
MDRLEIEHIAQLVVRDYGLPFRLASITLDPVGKCVIGFSNKYSRDATVSVKVWYGAKTSPHAIRESLIRELGVDG